MNHVTKRLFLSDSHIRLCGLFVFTYTYMLYLSIYLFISRTCFFFLRYRSYTSDTVHNFIVCMF